MGTHIKRTPGISAAHGSGASPTKTRCGDRPFQPALERLNHSRAGRSEIGELRDLTANLCDRMRDTAGDPLKELRGF